jgi:hypothetical protein
MQLDGEVMRRERVRKRLSAVVRCEMSFQEMEFFEMPVLAEGGEASKPGMALQPLGSSQYGVVARLASS